MKKIFFTFLTIVVFSGNIYCQTGKKLSPDNTIQIIGTKYSVDYNNNQLSETANPKTNVFDGNLTTFFASYDRSNTWVGLDLGEKHIITQVVYCPRPNYGERLELGVIEGANNPDFGDAIPLYVITNQPASNVLTEQTLHNSRGFRYVRYVGPNNVRCNIAELEFYGYPSDGDDSQLTQITNIPDVIIHTTEAQDITSKETYIKGIVSFISENGTKIYTDSLDIRGRGNASWGFEKKPYRLKLYNKIKLLGNPAEGKNWTLINNYGDKTLMRNLLAFDLSKRLEMPYTPAGRPVNVFLNGEYKGCYQFCDHIDVRKNRVDIKEMDASDNSGEKLTGGYFIEMDAYAESEDSWFTSPGNNIPVTIKSPDSDVITEEQRNYIISHFYRWETAIGASNFSDPEAGFRKYMDTPSFLKHFLVGEFSGNTDTYWSVYMYKQRNDDKFYFGPVWDFDLAYENDSRTYPINANWKTDWLYRSGGSTANGIKGVIDRLLSDPALYEELRSMYAHYRNTGVITGEKLLAVVDNYVQEIDQSQKLNFKRWNILNTKVHMNNQPAGSYAGEVNIVKNYIKARIAWMDKKLNYTPTDIRNVAQSPIRLWTETGIIHIDNITKPTSIEVFDLIGKRIYKKTTNSDSSIPSGKGVYIVRLNSKTGGNFVMKCIVK
jgi:hypothetical protein